MAKEYFKEKGIEYTEHDVAADPAKAQEMIEKSGQMGVPVIDINGTITVGFDKPAIDEQLGL
jgi:glutaredoxin 3